ncbi:SMP-30/gluconolactonase/LRE family protein [Arenibacterium halophilum]|nr:SMP-30/gluconolactonase/LRE family protein [Arenibacterium halophilum]
MWMLPPPEIATEVFTEMPTELRRTGRDTAWAAANKGAPLDSFLEGPAFDAEGNLWCTDIPHGRVFRIDPSGTWTQVAEYDGEPNGLKFAPDGHIWLADYRNGIMRLDRDSGQVTPVLERRRAERFRGPNDLIFARNGDLYFTDQGQTGMHDPTGRVYRLGADGQLDCLISNGPSPNGLILDAEEKFLYVAMTRSNEVWRMPLLPEGGTTKVQVFARFFGGNSGPDGMALDRDGNVAVAHAGLGCIFQVDKLGQPRRIVRSCRGLTTTNLAYGGPDMDRMFITDSSTGTILCAQMDVAADPLPFR